MTENFEIKPVEMNPDNPNQKKKIVGISISSENRVFDDENEVYEYPLNVRFSDGKEETMFFLYDAYFRLINDIWNNPDFAKDADLITMEDKMKDAAPYNVFFNNLHLPGIKEQLYSVSFTDLLCPSLGKLKSSLQITFMAAIQWILMGFARRNLHKLPMTIIHGYTRLPWPEEETMKELYPNIDYHYIEVKKNETAIGCHHTKLSIFVYEDDSLRVVIGSANLYSKDWDIFNQQIWVSPLCPKLPEGSSVMNGESPTGFKFALLDYLFTYEKENISSMPGWIKRIENTDFSDIKVALLFSVPGVQFPRKNGSILHFLGHLLTRDCTIPAPKAEHDSWRIIAQTASLGLVGHNAEDWLTTHVLKALGSHKDLPYLPSLASISKAKFSLIFPTVQNVLNGYFGVGGAACCNYEKSVKDAQPWLLKYKCQWKADGTERTRIISHSKSYCRVSPCWQKMAYYFLTSANLSRSAWGKIPDRDTGIYIRSCEIGVLFLPKYFGEEYFEVKDIPNRRNKKLFPMMFDLPLTQYGPIDDSFCLEELTEREDKENQQSINFDSIQKENDAENSLVNKALKKSDDCLVPPSHEAVTKCDENAAKNTDIPETKKKDMKFNIKPRSDMFFPSFNKKS